MQKVPRVSRKIALTDRFVRALKASGGRAEVGDSICRGLSIRCAPGGVKDLDLAYRLNGRTRRITASTPAWASAKPARRPTRDARNVKPPKVAPGDERAVA
jgi:hypothetical protein